MHSKLMKESTISYLHQVKDTCRSNESDLQLILLFKTLHLNSKSNLSWTVYMSMRPSALWWKETLIISFTSPKAEGCHKHLLEKQNVRHHQSGVNLKRKSIGLWGLSIITPIRNWRIQLCEDLLFRLQLYKSQIISLWITNFIYQGKKLLRKD